MAKGSALPILLLAGGAGLVAWLLMSKKTEEQSAPAKKPLETGAGSPPKTSPKTSAAAPGPGYKGAGGDMHAGEVAFRAAEALRVFRAQHGGMTPEQFTAAQQAAGDAAAKAAAAAQSARWQTPARVPTGADSSTWGSGMPGSVIDPYGEQARAAQAAYLDRVSTRPADGGFIYKDQDGACKVSMWAGDPESNAAALVPCFLRQDGCGDLGFEGQMWSLANVQRYVAAKCANLEPGGWSR